MNPSMNSIEFTQLDEDQAKKRNSEPLTIAPGSEEYDEYDNPYFYDYSETYRWAMLTACVIIAIFTGPMFVNWPSFDKMFRWANAYSHLCDPTDSEYKLLDHGEISCPRKIKAIEAIIPAAAGAVFGAAPLSGIILDSLGGKICTMFGLSCEIMGWILLGISGPNFNGYLAGAVMVGMGADPTIFGLLSITNLFPGWNSTVMSVLGAGLSLSLANGPVMEGIWNQKEAFSLRGISFVYAGIVGLCLVFTTIFIPLQTYPKLPAGVKLNTEVSEGKISYTELVGRRPRLNIDLFFSEVKSQIRGFLQYALTLSYIILCVLPVITSIRFSYYMASYKYHLPNAQTFYSITLPLSVFACPILGVLADRVSTVFTMMLLSVCGSLSMLLVMFDVVAFQYISVVLNLVFVSFAGSQFYVYVGYCYPQEQMGKLVGFCLLIMGLSSLLADAMNKFSVRRAMDLLVVLLGVLAIGVCVYLYIVVERPIRRRAASKTPLDPQTEEAV